MIKTEYGIKTAKFVWLNWLSVVGCRLLVVGWYCLPDSRPLLIYNPGTSSRVTLALLGIVFQTNLIASVVCYWLLVVGWYCLPDSRPLLIYNPETSSRVTLALLGIVFQTNLIASVVCYWLSVVGCGFSVVGSFGWKPIPSAARVTRDEVSGLQLRRKELSGRQYLIDKRLRLTPSIQRTRG